MIKWTLEDLTWYHGASDFDLTPWWQLDPESSNSELDKEHESLRFGTRSNNTAIYRMGPIYWETLRRHPELPKLLRAVQVTAGGFPSSPEIKTRLKDLPKAQEAIVFYLATLCRSNWVGLSPSIQARFDKFIRKFCRLTPGTDGECVIRSSNSVIDMTRTSFDEFGYPLAIGGFLKKVRVADFHPECHQGDIPPDSEEVTVLQIYELQEELKDMGLDLMLLAVDSRATEAAVAGDFERLFSKAYPDAKRINSYGAKLTPDRLMQFSEFDRISSYDDGGRVQLLKYFNEFSFTEIIGELDDATG